MTRVIAANVPHNHALGLQVQAVGDGVARCVLPWATNLVGNPETGVLHGGAITALLDMCCGAAVFAALTERKTIATLDLRIDYLRPAEARRDVTAHSTCYRVTRNVAFVRAFAFHDDEAQPIAAAAGTFMLGTRSARR